MSDELSPEAQAAIARIKFRQAPEPVIVPPPPLDSGPVPLALKCDRCGVVWSDGDSKTELKDNAKFTGWAERRRFSATRHYYPSCAGQIAAREEIRRKGKRR